MISDCKVYCGCRMPRCYNPNIWPCPLDQETRIIHFSGHCFCCHIVSFWWHRLLKGLYMGHIWQKDQGRRPEELDVSMSKAKLITVISQKSWGFIFADLEPKGWHFTDFTGGTKQWTYFDQTFLSDQPLKYHSYYYYWCLCQKQEQELWFDVDLIIALTAVGTWVLEGTWNTEESLLSVSNPAESLSLWYCISLWLTQNVFYL